MKPFGFVPLLLQGLIQFALPSHKLQTYMWWNKVLVLICQLKHLWNKTLTSHKKLDIQLDKSVLTEYKLNFFQNTII